MKRSKVNCPLVLFTVSSLQYFETYHKDARYLSGSILIDETTWWITGGDDYGDSHLTSEIFTVENGWEFYARFPINGFEQGHCILQLNKTHDVAINDLEGGN